VQQLTNRRLLAIEDVLANDDRAVVIARERFERDGRVLEARCDPARTPTCSSISGRSNRSRGWRS